LRQYYTIAALGFLGDGSGANPFILFLRLLLRSPRRVTVPFVLLHPTPLPRCSPPRRRCVLPTDARAAAGSWSLDRLIHACPFRSVLRARVGLAQASRPLCLSLPLSLPHSLLSLSLSLQPAHAAEPAVRGAQDRRGRGAPGVQVPQQRNPKRAQRGAVVEAQRRGPGGAGGHQQPDPGPVPDPGRQNGFRHPGAARGTR
jgi:hypothetical protein